MRRLVKSEPPSVLQSNELRWLAELKTDPGNRTFRYRYRHPDIKSALREETKHKCAYCESKLGHNTPGDIEHKVPSSKDINQHFTWTNLTLACCECNRRKNDYFEKNAGFLDPYVDDVEAILVHCGPVVRWREGDSRGEVAVKTLGLLGTDRLQLICRKVEKLQEVADLLERWQTTADPALKMLLARQLLALKESSAEYSAMVASVLDRTIAILSTH